MNTSKPLSLALLLGLFNFAFAQTPPRQVKLNPEWKPYEWSMMPADEFFKLTGLNESDSIAYRTYRLGTDTIGSVKVYMTYIRETNSDVVGYIKYENIKIKDIFKLDDEIGDKYDVSYGDADDMPWFFIGDAMVQLNYLNSATVRKRGHLELYSNSLYPYVPAVEHVLDKLDSTWVQLINNPTANVRGIVHDSEAYRVMIEDVSPMIEYEIVYPHDESEAPYAMTITTIDDGLKALKWHIKQYYTEFLDHMEKGEIWAAPSDGSTVRLAYFFNSGIVIHSSIPYSEYIEWMNSYEEDE